MVGGKISIVTELEDSVEVNCVGTGSERYDRCAIKISKQNHRWKEMKSGDSFWWQGRKAMWTPKENCLYDEESKRLGHKIGVHWDIEFDRIGYSYSPK